MSELTPVEVIDAVVAYHYNVPYNKQAQELGYCELKDWEDNADILSGILS